MVQKRPLDGDAEKILKVTFKFKQPKQVGPSNEPNEPMSFAESSVSSCEDLSLGCPTRTLIHYEYEDIYSILLQHPPTKLVSVGPNHQADLPEWDYSDNKVDERLMGTCIIPMPNVELSTYENEQVGKGITDDHCSCEDKGSVRCVRQHIVEEREGLMKNIGHEIFTDLGLSEMGEQVADKWSEEEEQLFCEVVFNSPPTLHKTSFWNYLSIAFPLKTKKEIVSYYFNVFMLRRRAEQNRSNLLTIDSDDEG